LSWFLCGQENIDSHVIRINLIIVGPRGSARGSTVVKHRFTLKKEKNSAVN
jgi:hypothetical protein